MGFAVQWRSRREPLTACGGLAFGAVARRLAERILRAEDPVLASLRGLAGTGVLLVLGDADLLPWADGIEYLGRSPDAPSLLLPTCFEPGFGDALFERAIMRKPGGTAPLAVSPARRRLVSAAAAGPIDRSRLAQWLSHAEVA
jgi:hypothetical protein